MVTSFLLRTMGGCHGLRTPREGIAFTARPKIQSQSQIFRYGWSIFCLPHRPNFSDIFNLCLHWMSIVRARDCNIHTSLSYPLFKRSQDRKGYLLYIATKHKKKGTKWWSAIISFGQASWFMSQKRPKNVLSWNGQRIIKTESVKKIKAVYITRSEHLKFIYSEKATRFCEISTLLLTACTVVKRKVEISQNFVAFSEYMNFKSIWVCNLKI